LKYYSTNRQTELATFKEAIFEGLPDDSGLFMPESIPQLSPAFWNKIRELSLTEIGYQVVKPFVEDEIPESILEQIISETLSFEIPLVQVNDNLYSLELFHGPTFAFKDVGARFLARCLSYFSQKNQNKLTVLVATSGDTGSAVAQGFYEVPNIDVVILYPSGRISAFQEQQMTTLGKNITALEVDGTFDDCQKLVKMAFLDQELNNKISLTSANSINIARLIPQSIYYFHAFAQLPKTSQEPLIISVPSGNYGNLTAGLLAQRMGVPIQHFLACSNINNTVPQYLKTGKYVAKASRHTISNAMDVGDPSNFARMLNLFGDTHELMKEHITGYSFSDAETKNAIQQVYNQSGYILDPHGAVGYLGLQNYLEQVNGTGIFLETAHPYKFKESVEPQIGKSLSPLINQDIKNKTSLPFSTEFEELKTFLMDS
jgi:threonine synthase